jgi:hypothetical protein
MRLFFVYSQFRLLPLESSYSRSTFAHSSPLLLRLTQLLSQFKPKQIQIRPSGANTCRGAIHPRHQRRGLSHYHGKSHPEASVTSASDAHGCFCFTVFSFTELNDSLECDHFRMIRASSFSSISRLSLPLRILTISGVCSPAIARSALTWARVGYCGLPILL